MSRPEDESLSALERQIDRALYIQAHTLTEFEVTPERWVVLAEQHRRGDGGVMATKEGFPRPHFLCRGIPVVQKAVAK